MSTATLLHLDTEGLAPALPEPEAAQLAAQFNELSGTEVYPRSIAASGRSLFFLGRRGEKKLLGVVSAAPAGSRGPAGKFVGEATRLPEDGAQLTLTLCDTTAANAAALRDVLAFLVPQPLGLRKSAGCGDRLGLATPGHVRAVRRSTVAPILALQLLSENGPPRRPFVAT